MNRVELLEGRAMPDHVHMHLSVPPRYSVVMTMKKLSIIAIFVVCSVTGTMFGDNGDKGRNDTEKAAEKVAEQAAEKAVEKAEAKAAEKAELKAKRPEEWWETTKIHFFVFVVDIDNIDGAGQSFTANVYVRLRWKDSRLAHEGSIRTVPLEET